MTAKTTAEPTAKIVPPEENPIFLRSLWRVTLGRYDVLLASVTINFLVLGLPLVILQVYDRILPSEATGTFGFLIAGLCVIVVIDGSLRWVRSNIVTWSAARFEHATLRRAVDRLIGSNIEEFERWPAGTHLDRISAMEALRDYHSGQGLIALSELPFVFIFLGLIWLIGGPIVYPPLVVVTVAGIVALFIGRKLERAYRDRSALDDKRYNFAFQVLSGIHTVKGLGMELQMVRRYQALLSPLAGAVMNTAFYASLGQSLGTTLGNIAMVSVAAAGSVSVINGTISGGALLACTLLAGRAIQPLIRMIGMWVQSRNLKLAEERLNELMKLKQENRPRNAPKLQFQGEVRLENLTVHRGRVAHPVLKNVNLHIKPGEIVAITGSVGGSKTALLDLLAGLMEPDEGTLLLDDVDFREIDIAAYRQQIGFARQNSIMYRGTILDNLTKFQGSEDLAPALAIANELGLDEEIAQMPKGLSTPVGDSASDALSASVQQEIALVRALAHHPKLFLFDEANTALDFETDASLRKILQRLHGETTIVMVTSRPSMFSIADRVYEANGGVLTQVNMGHALSPNPGIAS